MAGAESISSHGPLAWVNVQREGLVWEDRALLRCVWRPRNALLVVSDRGEVWMRQ